MKWIELDGWARSTGKTFQGTMDELKTHLLGLVGQGKVESAVQEVTLNVAGHLGDRVSTTVTILRLPWGAYRWIPEPRAAATSRSGRA